MMCLYVQAFCIALGLCYECTCAFEQEKGNDEWCDDRDE